MSGQFGLLSGRLQRRQIVGAVLIFLCVSLCYYGRFVISNISEIYVGTGHDPAGYMWSLVWWPYAFSHALNPFIARVIWSPVGFNLAWAAAIPGPSLILWPITYWLGPVVSFNVLMILTPVIVATSAFELCRYLCNGFWASVLGGYLFGFSPYMMGHQLLGQPNLTLIFGVPLCLYLLVRRLNDDIGIARFAVLTAIVLTLQFLVSTEIVALMTLFGAFAFAIAWMMMPSRRSALKATIAPVVVAYALFGVLVSPYLYYAIALGIPEQMHPVEKCAADLFGYLTPSPMMLGGGPFARFADTLTPHVWYGGKGLYTNPPLIIILIAFVYRCWREPSTKLLALCAVVVVVCSFGPRLYVLDYPVIRLPWHWIMTIPTLNQALPVRFAMFFFLIASIVATLFLSDQQVPRYGRLCLGVIAIVLWMPNRHYRLTVPQSVDTPSFFTSEALKRDVANKDTLLIFPFSIQGTSMLWQAQANLYFDMVGGYISTFVPDEFRDWPVVQMMLRDNPEPGFANQLRPFLTHYNVKAIVVTPQAKMKWQGPIDELGIKPESVGTVLFYRIRP